MKEDIIGKRFGRLTVIECLYQNKWHVKHYLCKCDCGNEKVIARGGLITGATKSCGCLNIEMSAKRIAAHATKHGYSHKERLYETWKNMNRRCYNPTNKRYANYGGRGIKVCDQWKSDYLSFRNWAMANGYADNLSIDRIDNDGNYEPSNCQFTTAKQQANNVSRNHVIQWNGKSLTISEWSDALGIPYGVLNHRVHSGWSAERMFTAPVRRAVAHI